MEVVMKKWSAMLLLAILVVVDQVTKYIASVCLQGKDAFVIIKNVLEFRYLEGGNTGAAFGILEGKTVALGVVSVVVSIVLLVVYLKISGMEKYKGVSLALLFMIAGAVGNGIDRLVHQYVIDFIYVKAINFPIFNVADCYVTLAAVALFLLIAFDDDEEEKKLEQEREKRLEQEQEVEK